MCVCVFSSLLLGFSLAYLLHSGDRKQELGDLSAELLEITTERPEPWIVAAFYAQSLGQRGKSAEYLQRAQSCFNPADRPGWGGLSQSFGWVILPSAGSPKEPTQNAHVSPK